MDANPVFRELIEAKHKAYLATWLLENVARDVLLNGSTFFGEEYLEEVLYIVNSRGYHPRLQGSRQTYSIR